jgi:dolichyl-phosphate-mannose-protein mannosyltransferase
MEQGLRWQPAPGAHPHVAALSPSAAVAPIIALALAACFAALLLGTLDFPLGTHADEPSKAIAVLNHHNNYSYSLLMLHIVRAANAVAGLADPQQVAELGRACAVFAGAAAMFVTFLLAREVLPAPVALGVAAATAATPLVTVHARYFKEDIFLLLFILLSLLALLHALKAPTRARAILLGLAVGLAAATKYVAIIMVPFAVLVLLIGLSGVADWRKFVRLSGVVALAALAAFALIHAPVLWDFAQFKLAFATGLRQAETGHQVRACRAACCLGSAPRSSCSACWVS